MKLCQMLKIENSMGGQLFTHMAWDQQKQSTILVVHVQYFTRTLAQRTLRSKTCVLYFGVDEPFNLFFIKSAGAEIVHVQRSGPVTVFYSQRILLPATELVKTRARGSSKNKCWSELCAVSTKESNWSTCLWKLVLCSLLFTMSRYEYSSEN